MVVLELNFGLYDTYKYVVGYSDRSCPSCADVSLGMVIEVVSRAQIFR